MCVYVIERDGWMDGWMDIKEERRNDKRKYWRSGANQSESILYIYLLLHWKTGEGGIWYHGGLVVFVIIIIIIIINWINWITTNDCQKVAVDWKVSCVLFVILLLQCILSVTAVSCYSSF
jgi:hypothetical protein